MRKIIVFVLLLGGFAVADNTEPAVSHLDEGISWGSIGYGETRRYYFCVSEAANPIITNNGRAFYSEKKYEDHLSFVDGMAAVKKSGKWGMVDKTDRTVLPFVYDSLWYFFDEAGNHNTAGMAQAAAPDPEDPEGLSKFGYINIQGEAVIPLIYDAIYPLGYGKWEYAIVAAGMHLNEYGEKSGGKWGVIDRRGEIVLPIQYKSLIFSHKADFPYLVLRAANFSAESEKYDEFTIVIDVNGQRHNYLEIEGWHYGQKDGVKAFLWARDYDSGLFTFVRTADGTRLIEPVYEFASGFHDGLAKVILNDKIGFIDETGALVIPPKYDVNLDKAGGVHIRMWKGYLPDMPLLNNHDGAAISPDASPFLMSISPSALLEIHKKVDWEARYGINGSNALCVGDFSGGLALVQVHGKYGYIDKTGAYLVEPQYEGGTMFKVTDKGSFAAVKMGEKWGRIGTDGKLMTKFKYKSIYKAGAE